MGALDDVVFRLRALRVARYATLLTQFAEIATAGEEFVHIRLVARVPDDGVTRGIENAVHRNRELNNAEIGAEVAATAGDLTD